MSVAHRLLVAACLLLVSVGVPESIHQLRVRFLSSHARTVDALFRPFHEIPPEELLRDEWVRVVPGTYVASSTVDALQNARADVIHVNQETFALSRMYVGHIDTHLVQVLSLGVFTPQVVHVRVTNNSSTGQDTPPLVRAVYEGPLNTELVTYQTRDSVTMIVWMACLLGLCMAGAVAALAACALHLRDRAWKARKTRGVESILQYSAELRQHSRQTQVWNAVLQMAPLVDEIAGMQPTVARAVVITFLSSWQWVLFPFLVMPGLTLPSVRVVVLGLHAGARAAALAVVPDTLASLLLAAHAYILLVFVGHWSLWMVLGVLLRPSMCVPLVSNAALAAYHGWSLFHQLRCVRRRTKREILRKRRLNGCLHMHQRDAWDDTGDTTLRRTTANNIAMFVALRMFVVVLFVLFVAFGVFSFGSTRFFGVFRTAVLSAGPAVATVVFGIFRSIRERYEVAVAADQSEAEEKDKELLLCPQHLHFMQVEM